MRAEDPPHLGDRHWVAECAVARRDDELGFRRGEMGAGVGDDAVRAVRGIPAPAVAEDRVVGSLDRAFVQCPQESRLG